MRRYDESRENLDRTYKLCPECDDKVNSFISEDAAVSRNVDLSVLHSYLHQINNKTLNTNFYVV
jgi:hypothetical protein